MRQLTGLDASFLDTESHRVYGHVNGLLVVDPTEMAEPFTTDRVRELFEERLHLLPALRWRLVEVPLGIDMPYWADDPDLDLDFHIREIAIPAPGTDQQLAEQVSRLAARPLDRSRPLWELYVIYGLEGGRVAIMTKLHHAAVDGASGMQILATLMDTSPEGRMVTPPAGGLQGEKIPTELEMFGRGMLGLLRRPERALRLQAKLLGEMPGMAGNALVQLGSRLAGDGGKDDERPALPRTRAPRTSFNKTVTPHRRWAFGSLPLAEVKAVKNAFDLTINDVVMGLCAGALRRWLIDHDELPEEPLIAMVPVSIRTAEQAAAMGNQVSSMFPPLPTNVADPVERLRVAHEAMAGAKEQHKALPAHLLVDFSQFAAPASNRLIARTLSGLRVADYLSFPFNLTISNVPGPREPLYYAGAPLVANYPVSIVTDGMGLNITVQSYKDHLDFGIMVCRELVPDVWNMIGYLREGLDELLAAIPAETPAETKAETKAKATAKA
jgi:WS/DGAT/MGAT family acyltransferase